MKTKLFYLCLGVIALSMVSCESENNSDANVNRIASKQNVVTTSTNINLPDYSPCVTTDLLAGQLHDAGDVRVYFDSEKVYVEYETSGDWHIKKTHLYVGDLRSTPITRSGSPVPQLYPMGEIHPDGVQTLVYAIARTDLPKCFSISANAEVYRVENGEIVQAETAWATGDRFNDAGWAMFFDVCQSECWN